MTSLYQNLANSIIEQIENGVFTPGDRLPGVRRLARQYKVSVSTAVMAQQTLEDQGYIKARPRSGYFVQSRHKEVPSSPSKGLSSDSPSLISGQELAMRLGQATQRKDIIKLGAAVPDPSFLPTRAIHRSLSRMARAYPDQDASYEFPPGNQLLRRQIAKRMVHAGCAVSPQQVVITNGCQEALMLCLRAVTQPGDVVALESPTFYGLLQVVESLGLQALEIPADSSRGMDLSALENALAQWPIKACIVVANFSNPSGYCMSTEDKLSLVSLLAQKDIPLIEDDIYGDLAFGEHRPLAAKHFDTQGNVLYCSSFSKTVSPGLRVGWVSPGRYQQQIEYLKYINSLATPGLAQLAMADYLEHGGYERHLRRLRTQYAALIGRFSQAIAQHFPAGTKISRPEGGFVLWVELPETVESLKLYQQALQHGISIAPGPMFSARQEYRNFIRINCAQVWRPEIEEAIATLGRLV